MKEAKIRYITLALIAAQMILIFFLFASVFISSYIDTKIVSFNNEYTDIILYLLFFLAVGAFIILGVYHRVIFYLLIVAEMILPFVLAVFLVSINFDTNSENLALVLFVAFIFLAPLVFFVYSLGKKQKTPRKEKQP